MSRSCFHCAEPVPDGFDATVRAGDAERPVCCYGCKAAAEFIQSSGLGAFYSQRGVPDGPESLRPGPGEFAHYDSEELRQRYVSDGADGRSEATLQISGIYCSACIWLLDKVLRRIPGVRDVAVNPSSHRAVLAWDSDRLPFSALLSAISRLGFKPAPVSPGRLPVGRDAEYRIALKRLIVAAAAGMQVMMFAVALYAGGFYGIAPELERFLRYVSMLVCIPIVFYSARPFFDAAWRGISARAPGMDVPVSLAIGIAFVASTLATFTGSGEIYFDSVAMFVLFLSGTRFLEMRARHRSDERAQAIAQLLPDLVTQLVDGQHRATLLDRVRVGDLLLVGPADIVPVDGIVVEGKLAVDESVLTGEARPISRTDGDKVIAGGQNRAGTAVIKATRVGAATSLAEVGRLLEKAQSDRPPMVELADRIASWFVVGVLLLALLTGLVWWHSEPASALPVVLAVLVVSCPCALALATPAAVGAAASRLAKDGILLVRARILEVLRPGVTVVFDKTGTLTSGRPTVTGTVLMQAGAAQAPEEVLGIAAALESASEHVLARAFAPHVRQGAHRLESVEIVPGAGISARVDGRWFRIGSARFAAGASGVDVPDTPEGDPATLVFLGSESGLVASFTIGDELREGAAATLSTLTRMGMKPAIASGDRAEAVADVADKLGISEWKSGMTPAGKLALLGDLHRQGRKVVMVGDGINDAPILAAADASIALDAGTALARASADAVVLGQGLGALGALVTTAVRARRIIRQNLAWALGYNVAAIPLAASGVLAPWMAALGMSLSSLVVVSNALRLRRSSVRSESERESASGAARPEAAT